MKHLFVVPTAGSILLLLLLLMVQLAGLNKVSQINESLFSSSSAVDISDMSFAPAPAINIATPQVLTPAFDEAPAQPPAMDVSAIEADSPLAQLLDNIEMQEPVLELAIDVLDVSLQVDVANDFLDGIAIARPKTVKVKKATKALARKTEPALAKTAVKSAQEQSVAKGAVAQQRIATPISRVKPRYPSRAKKRGIEGVVVVSFVVNTNGSVNSQSIRIVRANPAKVFNKSVRRALLKWKFAPVDKEYRTQYTLDFSLKK
jgi:protein TonB